VLETPVNNLRPTRSSPRTPPPSLRVEGGNVTISLEMKQLILIFPFFQVRHICFDSLLPSTQNFKAQKPEIKIFQ
jgi:hypothetical protein